jgi:23S rRNA (uracil1939-C5)-methyltransferase
MQEVVMGKREFMLPVVAGQEYSIEVSGLGHSGEGVGRYEGFTVFIPHAMPGERVQVKVTEVKKNYARGELLSVITPSPHRVKPVCHIYEECGGCQLQHMSYGEQLTWKRQVVVDAITRIGKLRAVTVHPTLGTEDPWYYRNKMQFPVGERGGDIVAGCFARGSHDIVDTERCYIQHALNNEIVVQAKQIIQALHLTTYNEKTGTGLIRHILGRVGVKTGEVMVVLVTNGLEIPRKNEVIALLQERIPGIVSIIQNINTKNTNVILGEEARTLWGQDTITDYIGPFQFKIAARSFFQVNTPQAAVLYNKALEYARLSGKETVIDAYCGTGTITLFLAQKAHKVYGIEVVPEAIENAKDNAALNGITNAKFSVGDAVELMPRMFQAGIRPEVIVVDPPRAGCAQEVLDTFIKMEPQCIVYVSCNPSSLARDLAYLEQFQYHTEEIAPVDMFPHTSHVECVALIERG